MRDLTDKVGTLVSVQTQAYDLMKNSDDRQTQLSNQQDQIIQILKSLSQS